MDGWMEGEVMPAGRILTPRSRSEPGRWDAWLPWVDAWPCRGSSAGSPSPSGRRGPDSVSLFHLQRPQASHPLLPAQPLVLQLAEHLLVQPEPQPQLRQLQLQPQPQPDSQPPQPLPQPQPQPQLQQPQQLRERRLLSPPRPRPQPPDSPALPPPCRLRPQKGRDRRGGGKEPGDAKDGPGSGESTDGNSHGSLQRPGRGWLPLLRGVLGSGWGRGGYLLTSASAGVGRGGVGEHRAREQMLCRDLGASGWGWLGTPLGPPCAFLV